MRFTRAAVIAGLTLCTVIGARGAAPEQNGSNARPALSERSESKGVPTFTKDVAPILYKNCVSCHRPGEIAPMSLLTYADARPYAKAIRDEVGEGHMPPWHADPSHGAFANDRSLTVAEKGTLLKWANNGAPEGDPKDLPAAPAFVDGWTIGRPDTILTMPVEYTVPADGFVEYEYFEIPTNFTEDKWVEAVEVRPGNREVVHHVIVTMRPAQPERRPSAFQGRQGMGIRRAPAGAEPKAKGQRLFPAPQRLGQPVGGFAPGTQPLTFAPGTALLVRAGSTIVLQMHYTPNGERAKDRTQVGLKFAEEKPQVEMRLATLINGAFEIPAGAADHVVDAEMTTTADVTLRSMLPHTHLRGKSWEYTVTYPGGRSEVILSVPKYDFNWQTDYVFAKPLKLPKGTKIRAVARYDNSAANKSNPDPSVAVKWGDQTWEEMMFTSIVYSIDGVAPGTTLPIPAAPGGGQR